MYFHDEKITSIEIYDLNRDQIDLINSRMNE